MPPAKPSVPSIKLYKLHVQAIASIKTTISPGDAVSGSNAVTASIAASKCAPNRMAAESPRKSSIRDTAASKAIAPQMAQGKFAPATTQPAATPSNSPMPPLRGTAVTCKERLLGSSSAMRDAGPRASQPTNSAATPKESGKMERADHTFCLGQEALLTVCLMIPLRRCGKPLIEGVSRLPEELAAYAGTVHAQ